MLRLYSECVCAYTHICEMLSFVIRVPAQGEREGVACGGQGMTEHSLTPRPYSIKY